MRTSPSVVTKVLLITCCVLLAASSAFAVNGAIFTTNSTGTKVNGNLYAAKTDVYLNGGPQNQKDPGLVPLNGNYYFQVTDPSGHVLLSADDISCREVTVSNGRIVGVVTNASCVTDPHLLGTFNSSNGEQPVQLCPAVSSPPRADTLNDGNFDPNNWCDTTPNPGGEYKAWLTPVGDYGAGDCTDPSHVSFGFCDADSKTDNFKVQPPQPPPCTGNGCPGPPPPSATLVACKYWDKDDDGFNQGPDVLLGGWTITATADAGDAPGIVITNGASSGSSASGVTDSITGCTTFTITGFPDASTVETFTVSETQQTNWNQVAPLNGTYNGGTGGSITVSEPAGGIRACTADPTTLLVAPCTSTSDVPLIGDGTTTLAPDFGNTGIDLTVTKTASPSFTRTYSWSINKSVTPGEVDQSSQTPPATFNYTVVVSETSFADSAWEVTGSVTVSNPNNYEVDGVTISENGSGKSLNGENCTFDNQILPAGATNNGATITGVNLAAGGSLSATYTCTYTSSPGSGTNDATATWDASKYNTPDGSADSGTSGAYAFGSPTSSVYKTITPQDSFNGGAAVNLCTLDTTGPCTLTATDTKPYTTHTYTYSRNINIPDHGCQTYPNEASIKETGQTSDASVKVCRVPAKTGALTMGFWQNKNGQGIITGQLKTGTCPSATWLRNYAPFQDLSSTATCSAVATYVYNVIKAANCGGATCNTMLKAQMLATALDVYFSDPVLGGNKIGAPKPIGGLSIDLTQVCGMIDGSGGTATCSGTYQNDSGAFGGAHCLTVLQALACAASQSNVGGTTWYGNNKATQVMAKNVFDAINNVQVFLC